MGGLLQEVQPFFIVRIMAVRLRFISRARLWLVGWLSRWRTWGTYCNRIRVEALMGGSR